MYNLLAKSEFVEADITMKREDVGVPQTQMQWNERIWTAQGVPQVIPDALHLYRYDKRACAKHIAVKERIFNIV